MLLSFHGLCWSHRAAMTDAVVLMEMLLSSPSHWWLQQSCHDELITWSERCHCFNGDASQLSTAAHALNPYMYTFISIDTRLKNTCPMFVKVFDGDASQLSTSAHALYPYMYTFISTHDGCKKPLSSLRV